MPTRDEIFEQVRATLMEALELDEDDVTPEATLIADLGAEPVMFLDIVLRLEKGFDIRIPHGDLFPENLSEIESTHVVRGLISEDGIEELRDQLPYANVDKFAEDPRPENIQDLLTVEMIVNYLEAELPQIRNQNHDGS